MAQGRPKVPTAIKQLEGTYREDRVVSNEMMPAQLSHIPSAPEWMEERAVIEWESVCDELIALNMLHRVDLSLLASYCQELANYFNAIEQLRENGWVNSFTREDGSQYHQPSPWVAIKNSAFANFHKAAMQFGFTPAARTKISQGKPSDEDPFEKVMKMA